MCNENLDDLTPYLEREALKSRAHAQLAGATALAERIAAVMALAHAWYERSREFAVRGGYAASHPGFDRWLRFLPLEHAVGHAPDAVAEIRGRVGSFIAGEMAAGDSIWRPRRAQ